MKGDTWTYLGLGLGAVGLVVTVVGLGDKVGSRKIILMVKPVEKWFVFYKQVDKTVLFLVIVILSGFPDD